MKNIGSRRQCGVSLIEVLIAVVILSIGMLGIAGLQTTGMQTSFTSYQYTQAVALAQGMLDRMRANRGQAQAGAYNRSTTDTPSVATNCATTSCSAAAQAVWDFGVFYKEVKGGTVSNVPAGPSGILPGALVSIICADSPCLPASPHVITVYWDANRTGATGTGCDAAASTDLRCYRLSFVP